jgi:retron-type reverse transcriptase
MKTHKHLFERVCALDNLLAASREALKNGKRGKPPGARYFAELEKEAVRLRAELLGGTHRHGAYTYFTIQEPKQRLVAAAPFRDRVVHHAIVRVLEPIFEKRFIADSFACRKGKGTHAALRRCAQFAQRYRFALKCDVSKYFPSIDHEILTGLLRRAVADERLLALIAEVLASHRDGAVQEWPGGDLFAVKVRPRGLPIGNLTSQFFANIYLDALDQWVKHDLRVRGYVRYVDDFILFADDRAQLRRWAAAVRARLTALRLQMHPDKCRLLPTRLGVDFVGFVCFADGRRRVRAANVRRFVRRFRAMRHEVRRGRRTWSDVTLRVRSWAAHAAHAPSWRLRAAVFARM